MLSNKSPYAHPFAIAAVTLAFLAGIGAMVPASAADAMTPVSASPAAVSNKMNKMDEKVETRIKDLHTRLAITSAQEDSWGQVVQVMRDNESTMASLTQARMEKAGTMNAVDDLNSYAEIASAHADGLHKFTPAFTALYNTMSDSQKANADNIFRNHGDKMGKHNHSKAG